MITPRDIDRLPEKDKEQFKACINHILGTQLRNQRLNRIAVARQKEELGEEHEVESYEAAHNS